MRDAGYRPSDIELYRSGSTQRYAGIWVKNTEGLAWSSKRDLTSAQFSSYFTEQKNLGRRIIDIEVYPTSGGLRYAAIWYQNVGNVAWVELRDMTRSTYQTKLNEQTSAGYRLIDFESYQSGATQRYAAIWEKSPAGRAWVVRSDRSKLDFANLWRLYRDEGYRLVDFERYDTSGGARYAGVWVENDSRFDYSRKGTLDSIISGYRSDNNLPGISVALIRNGKIIYRRGFGYADVSGGKVAHGETVYNAGSVAKVIGGTLAGKLEAEDKLHDGKTFSLDLRKKIKSYLTHVPVGNGKFVTIPSQHTQNVDMLLSHLGCIAHYDTTPKIPNQTKHYANAIDAVQSIWKVGLVKGCKIGSTVSYSTPAFTFVGAVLERVTGRPVSRLLREEIAEPYGLSSLRIQFESKTLPANYDRAKPYNDNNTETTYQDNSWKPLSGGIEVNAVDLATFGWKVLDGNIVKPGIRDNRLWASVKSGCRATATSGACRYGLGWSRGTVGGRRVVDHDGSWTGARAFIRIYRDDGLVLAIMSNRTNHTKDGDVFGLATSIGNAVLAP